MIGFANEQTDWITNTVFILWNRSFQLAALLQKGRDKHWFFFIKIHKDFAGQEQNQSRSHLPPSSACCTALGTASAQSKEIFSIARFQKFSSSQKGGGSFLQEALPWQ